MDHNRRRTARVSDNRPENALKGARRAAHARSRELWGDSLVNQNNKNNLNP